MSSDFERGYAMGAEDTERVMAEATETRIWKWRKSDRRKLLAEIQRMRDPIFIPCGGVTRKVLARTRRAVLTSMLELCGRDSGRYRLGVKALAEHAQFSKREVEFVLKHEIEETGMIIRQYQPGFNRPNSLRFEANPDRRKGRKHIPGMPG